MTFAKSSAVEKSPAGFLRNIFRAVTQVISNKAPEKKNVDMSVQRPGRAEIKQ